MTFLDVDTEASTATLAVLAFLGLGQAGSVQPRLARRYALGASGRRGFVASALAAVLGVRDGREVVVRL